MNATDLISSLLAVSLMLLADIQGIMQPHARPQAAAAVMILPLLS